MTLACGPTGTSSPGTTSHDDAPTGPDQPSTCAPRQAGISADFELTVEDWPYDDIYDYLIAAPCQVQAASATTRQLSCVDEDGAAHDITLTIADPRILGVVPESGPVFLRAAHYTDYPAPDTYQWFEVRAGSEVTGALLAGGVRAYAPKPFDGYFAPIGILLATEEGCPHEIQDECVSHRRARLQFWIDDVPAGSILDGHEGDIGANGEYHVIVGASVDHSIASPSSLCIGDNPAYHDDLRFLIRANAPEGSDSNPRVVD